MKFHEKSMKIEAPNGDPLHVEPKDSHGFRHERDISGLDDGHVLLEGLHRGPQLLRHLLRLRRALKGLEGLVGVLNPPSTAPKRRHFDRFCQWVFPPFSYVFS